MRRDDVIEAAALKLCEDRKEDPDGTYAHHDSRGRVRQHSFLEQAKRDVQTVLDFAVPGFLDGNVEVLSTGSEYR